MADIVSQHIVRAIELGSQSAPLFPEIGVIAFVPEEWDSVWRSRHQILTRLSQYFHVVWAEPAMGWKELWFGVGKKVGRSHNQEVLPKGFVLYQSGRWLPKLYRPASLASWTAAQRVRRAATLLRRRGCRTIVFYLWRPDFDYALDGDSYDLSCYHIADEYSFFPSKRPLDDREVKLIKRVDQVFIHSPALIERKGHLNPHTLYVTNGVEYASFAAPHDEPTDMQHIPHPRIGYVGTIKTQLDLGLLCELATQHPAWSLVLVGPKGYLGDDAQFVEHLAAMRNVHFLGHKPVDRVCAYQQHIDVCLLPYKFNDYTKYIYPLKLHEYLAGGKPVVGTPIRSLLEFSHVIKLAGTHDEWSRAITESLAPDAITIDQIEKRRAIARQFDWGALVHTIARSICNRLGPPYKEQFNALNLEPFVPM